MATIRTTKISVKKGTIHCQGCASRIEKALRALPGVISVEVDIPNQEVVLRHDLEKTDQESIQQVLDDMGYPVEEVA